MKAMTINQFGGPDVFELSDVQQPEPKAGQVLVKIAATSVNTVDTMIRQMGADLPFSPALPAILGMDFAGTVAAVGEGVTEYKAGDDVYGCAGGLGDRPGALAEYMLADIELIAPKPASLNMRQAASLPLVAITAYEGLKRAGIEAGQQVLVHGGAGGVGHVALQLAKYWGATVTSTAGNEAHLALISQLGATPVNYRTDTVEDYVATQTDGKGFDLVFDSVGGANLSSSFAAAALNGQVATTVSLLELDLSLAHLKGLSLHVVFMLIPMIHNAGKQQHTEILRDISRIVDDGGLTPVLDEQGFSLTDTGNAHQHLNSGKATGKIVIDVTE